MWAWDFMTAACKRIAFWPVIGDFFNQDCHFEGLGVNAENFAENFVPVLQGASHRVVQVIHHLVVTIQLKIKRNLIQVWSISYIWVCKIYPSKYFCNDIFVRKEKEKVANLRWNICQGFPRSSLCEVNVWWEHLHWNKLSMLSISIAKNETNTLSNFNACWMLRTSCMACSSMLLLLLSVRFSVLFCTEQRKCI